MSSLTRNVEIDKMDSMSLLLLSLAIAVFISLLLSFLLKGGRHRLPLPPGPKPWPVLGNLPHLGTKPHQAMAAMTRKHGPMLHLRMGSVDVIVAASSSVAALFLKIHDANFSSRPPNSGAKYIAYNYQDLVFAPYGPRWRALRKICALHLFSAKAMDDFRYVREEEVRRLATAMAKSSSTAEAVDLAQLLNVTTTNALGRVLLGNRVFGDIEGEDLRKADVFKEMVVEVMVLAGVFNVGDFIPWLHGLDLQGVVRKMKALHRRFDQFLDGIIEEHRKEDPAVEHTNLLSVLMKLKDDGTAVEGVYITDTEIKALFLNLFTAGTDTSSSTTEWAIAELIRHPEVLAQAQRELDSVVGRDRLVSETDIPQLPYLQAVVKETFRLHPSTPLSLPRIASESCEINGYFIPKNSTLLVNVWAIGRDPDVWKDPLQFRPDRFLPGGEAAHRDVRGNDFEVIPFGAGRRICAGMSLGLRMVQFMTASLVHAFNWTLPEDQMPEQLDMEEAYGLTLQRAVPLQVKPQRRLAPHVYDTTL
ncbi:flavonoid 3'-monooxygenase [Aristolochia californica]|uniref:flavonoid 3'-monooxygenase n=1 Tax=Aristolochia californica TaxID=171875 RepID=UPI0035DA952E